MYDVVLIYIEPNILQGKITKSSQADLSERAIGNCILSKGCETDLVR